MKSITEQTWHVGAFRDTSQPPPFLHEIRVKDWSTGLVGDYRGCIVALVPGGYADDADTLQVAAENAALIASAPTLKAENAQLRADIAEALAKLARITRASGVLLHALEGIERNAPPIEAGRSVGWEWKAWVMGQKSREAIAAYVAALKEGEANGNG